jgi:peptidoglycan hydrolase FlgJ
VFLNMVMKSMRQAKLSDGILDSQQSDFYRDMYDQQMALQLAEKPGVGLANMIAKQLTPQPVDDKEKLQLDDYLNRAGSASPTTGGKVLAQASSNNATDQAPLDQSGLSSLERTLALLERQQSAMSPTKTTDVRWPISSIDDSEPNATKQEFIKQLRPYAQQAAQALGVDAHLLLAQAALETGWGQFMVKNGQGENSFNLFNIKADKSWQGKQAKSVTLEFDTDVAKKTVAGFRVYDSYKESFDDYVRFIKSNPRYSEALKKVGNAEEYIKELQQAGYATDPHYANKIISIYSKQAGNQAG